MGSEKSRVMVIGLDSAPPSLIFHKFLGEMPNLSELMDGALYGPLRSCHPPITVPAWAVMATSKTPGELGMYGFRHRRPGEYKEFYLVTSRDLREPAVWDIIAKDGKKSLLIAFPPSYPPKKINGWMISDFHTPSTAKSYTYPPWLRLEVERVARGPFTHDVEFRVEERGPLVERLFEMTRQHLKVAEHLAKVKAWDLFWYVEIGLDRLHHAFWKFFDPNHPRHVPNSEFEGVAERYYKLLDEGIGRLVRAAKDASIIIVSDHGTKPMAGAFVVNEWLADNGYLTFEERPTKQTDFKKAKIDWERTKAWGWGGYYARIFINLEGREPMGRVRREDFESTLMQLADDLKSVRDPKGREMRTMAYKPGELYPAVRGDAPDMIVYFDDLNWRSAGTVGHGKWYLPENDTGPDDAVHDWNGIYLLHDPEGRIQRGKGEASIYDVAPTILALMGLYSSEDMKGKALAEVF